MENTETAVKPCSRCGQTKSLDSFYAINGSYRNPCKECRKADVRRRLQEDPEYRERSRQRSRDRYHAHLESDGVARAKWREANRERLLADARRKGKQRYAENRKEILRRQAERLAPARQARREASAAKREALRREASARSEKACTHCGRVQPMSGFWPNKGLLDGHASWCKECQRAEQESRRARDRLTLEGRRKQRAAGLRQWHGITIEAYEAMWAEQGGACKACGETLVGRYAHVDHDHASGRIRGILCSACNHGLGYIKESAERAEGLARYIRTYCL